MPDGVARLMRMFRRTTTSSPRTTTPTAEDGGLRARKLKTTTAKKMPDGEERHTRKVRRPTTRNPRRPIPVEEENGEAVQPRRSKLTLRKPMPDGVTIPTAKGDKTMLMTVRGRVDGEAIPTTIPTKGLTKRKAMKTTAVLLAGA
jgi:hypothetical protein